MSNQDQHQMQLEKVHPSGAEEWFCPTCGRRFLMTWPPNYKKVILEAGDEYAIHNGGKGGLQLQAAQIEDTVNEPELSKDLREALSEVLDNINFDNWGFSAS